MSFQSERPGTFKDWLSGSALLASGLYLLAIYAEGQLGHTVRFLFELLVNLDRILGY